MGRGWPDLFVGSGGSSSVRAEYHTSVRSGLALKTLPILQIGDCSLPVFDLSEADRPVDAEILQKHAQHDEPLLLAGEDPTHVLDLIGRLVGPLVELLVRPLASLSANVPIDRFHRIAPPE